MAPNSGPDPDRTSIRTPDRTPDRTVPEHGPDAWVPLSDAAQRLGITYDAARRRIARGTLAAEKRAGRWYAFVPGAEPGPDPDPNVRPDAGPDATGREPDAMFAVLQEEIAFLRGELEARTEEIRRRDHIIAGLVERVRELPATTETPQEHDPGAQRDTKSAWQWQAIGQAPKAERRPWWRRLLGRSRE